MQADNSPLKRKLADMSVDLQTTKKELTAAHSKLADFQKKAKEEEMIRNKKEKQIALEKQIEDSIRVRMTEWEQLEREKEDVRATERAVATRHIAHLKHTISEKEEKEIKCCIM